MLPQTSAEHYAEQQRINVLTLAELRRLWGRGAPNDFDIWFNRNIELIIGVLELAQTRAVTGADEYVAAVLEELGTSVDADVQISTDPLIGVASDGRALDGLMYGTVLTAKQQVAQGAAPAEAWASAGAQALMLCHTQIADAARAAVGLGITARRGIGYVRMVSQPACSRCVLLAGRFYRKAGFARHPNCDCRHIPAREDSADDLTTEPRRYFNSLTEEQQNRAFTVAGAQAIRSGADIGQVVNARRGMEVAGGVAQRRNVYGRQLLTTTEGVTRRGIAGRRIRERGRDPRTTPRLMPEAIYEIGEDRDHILRLLRLNSFIL
ncbi:hypothetical protein GV794_01965 [Nocardia cyriacigeorgica]|uniref:Capsid maturation protease n=1 Tax=Nocardia cyriacigeorgica TaxID=135487 RepID=A0ABX0CEI0_9NOCA|nr:hypothetical protein [Nocardia cyriacigeorgica]NEW40789.1 hypothetical protein [Nocardia cyriacigeorgica]NEW50985.1 hypothetical protein [Nocardia cyriacigeorgica]NEW54432.1 hypothetical protein [Nocardia cyriacigeorgica]